MAFSYTTLLVLVLSLTLLVVYVVYHALLPKPIPGNIPFSKESAARILGDIPLAVKAGAENQQPLSFLYAKFDELKTPIFQAFLEPFGQPWVVLNDWRVAEDIMLRRSREFDKSPLVSYLLGALAPYNHLIGPANAKWHAARRAQADTMSPTFLNTVIAPSLHRHMQTCIALLDEQRRLAQGRPFDLSHSITMCLLDSIWTSTFGSELGACHAQKEYLSVIPSLQLSNDEEEIVTMPQNPGTAVADAVVVLLGSVEIPLLNPTRLGRIVHKLALRLLPRLVRARRLTDRLIQTRLNAVWQTVQSGKGDDAHVLKCAADLMLQQEVKAAEKQGRAPNPEFPRLKDDMFFFVLAGYETSTSTTRWGIKYLVKHQDVQRKLRESIFAFFAEGIQPSADMITKAKIPYLDAFVEEVLRHCEVVYMGSRIALVDTEVMGHFIPKGTTVCFHNQALLDPSQHASEKKPGAHKCLDVSHFDPERWLRDNEDGELEYDPQAAPMHAFSMGQRACFGKRLAYVQLRMMFLLLVWNFELHTTSTTHDFSGLDHLVHMPRFVHARLSRTRSWGGGPN